MKVANLSLLWVNVGNCGLDGTAKTPFERLFDITEIGSSELEFRDPSEAWDVICCDFDHPDMTALRLVPMAKTRWPSAPLIMLTMQNSAELAIWALRSRVFDLLLKPLASREVDRTLERIADALRARRSQTERKPQTIAAQLPTETRYQPVSSRVDRLQPAVSHLARHFLRPIPESEVAQLCNMSPSRFCREFKNAFNVTFVEYLAAYRMKQAKKLLANPSMPVADVAVAVGFNDPSYFTRVFRKQEGVSPSEYRATTLFEMNRLRTSAQG